jgi:hypothetical protein
VDLMKIAYSGWCLYWSTTPQPAIQRCSGRSRWVGISGRLYVAANLDALNNNERDHNDLWYDFNRNDITPTLIVNGTTASTDYLTGALTVAGVSV